jgi:oxygen-independent coproporphyrinogen-3 oxidase
MAAEIVAPLPLSLYVHLPWCVRKCPYCDFNSYEAGGSIPDLDYVDALLRDLDLELSMAGDRPLTSIFIGGGTPSLFSGAAIARLLDGVRARVALAADCEITLEANPGTAEAARFDAFRAAGINRLSLGIQSFRDAQLRRLGRIHDSEEARAAYAMARAAGFDNVNLDLMYALPEDDQAGALFDLEAALALAPAHLSWYQLTLEPDTAFHRRPPPLPDDDRVADMEDAGRAVLAAAGYARYEISAYAQPGRECRHNRNYWEYGDYLGIGAGAHGKLTDPASGHVRRRARQRNPRAYMKLAGTAAAWVEESVDSPARLVTEFMMNALRLVEGVPLASFEQRTGLSAARLDPVLATARDRGLIGDDPLRLRATATGLRYLNDLIGLFADAEPTEDRPNFAPVAGGAAV